MRALDKKLFDHFTAQFPSLVLQSLFDQCWALEDLKQSLLGIVVLVFAVRSLMILSDNV